jgi:hypothetical protein
MPAQDAELDPDRDVTTATSADRFSLPISSVKTFAKTYSAGFLGTMNTAPKWTEFPKYPVIAGTAILAISVTLAWWSKVNLSLLFPTAMIRRGEVWRLITSIFRLHSRASEDKFFKKRGL